MEEKPRQRLPNESEEEYERYLKSESDTKLSRLAKEFMKTLEEYEETEELDEE